MSTLTPEDIDTPQKRLVVAMQVIEAWVKEVGITQADVDYCREETRRIAQMMIVTHRSHPGAGATIDKVRARCDVMDAVLKYMRRAQG